MSITLNNVDSASTADIVLSEEFRDYLRTTPAFPGDWSADDHLRSCATCQSDTLTDTRRREFRDFLGTRQAPLADWERELLEASAEVVDTRVDLATAWSIATRYSMVPLRNPESEQNGYAIVDRDVPEEFIMLMDYDQGFGLRNLQNLNSEALPRTRYTWRRKEFSREQGWLFPGETPRQFELERDQARLLPFFRKVYQYVEEQGNAVYYDTLARSGVVPPVELVKYHDDAPDLERMTEILTAIGQNANDNDMCEVYDRMCADLGLPTRVDLGIRDLNWRVSGYVTVTVRVPVSATVRAATSDDAVEEADDPSNYVDSSDVVEAVRYGNYEIEDGEWEDADED
jgi:hypothetical protein